MSALLDTFCCTDDVVLKTVEECNTGELKETGVSQARVLFRDITGFTRDVSGEVMTSDAVAYLPIEETTETSTIPIVGSVVEYGTGKYRVERVTELKDYTGNCCSLIGFKLELSVTCLECV